jgi:hypothetical protein
VVGLVAAALAVAGCRPAPEAEAPEALRRAAAQVLSADCGNSVFDAGYQEHARILKDAGPAVVPVLTEMVADRGLSIWFVGNAAQPDSEAFRQALRGRRDDPAFGHDHGARLAVFDYFAACGDASDLAWMERAAESLDETRRTYADEPIGELRRRLGR